MSILDKNRVFDGWSNLSSGMDSGRNPSLIDPTQCATANNIVFRGGVPKPRPGVRVTYRIHKNQHMRYDVHGVFQSGGSSFQSSANFGAGIIQGACYYAPGGGKPESVMAMIGGRLYQIIPRPSVGSAGFSQTLEVTEIELDKTNSPSLKKAYLTQSDRFCVIQDGQSKAIIFDGVTARRAKYNEVPVGTIMAYGMGRLVVTVNDGRELEFGDLYGSNADASDPGAAVLSFTETTFLNEGGTASISFALGKITGLHFVPQQDSSVGDGELLAFSEAGISTFQLALPRDQWKQSAFQRVALYNIGARGWRSIVSINGDVWFRSDDGWRSYRQARAEINGWAHLPMSTEVRTWTDNDTATLLEYGSAIAFDNRLIATCTPQPNDGHLFHNGLLALDFDVLSSFGQATRPAWDGHWAFQAKVVQLIQGSFSGVHKAFAFALDPDSDYLNFIYEITKNDHQDYFNPAIPTEPSPIAWELITRSLDFQSPFNEKEIFGGDLWIDSVENSVTVSLDYRPDQHPNWTDWQTLPVISPVGTAQSITVGGVPTIRHNFFPRRTIIKPENDVDSESFTGRSMRRGFEFQARIRGTGYCEMRKFRMHAKPEVEDDKAKVP